MQDLLDEEEFIEKKSDYNPWKRFGVFYGVAFIIVILLYYAFTYAGPQNLEVLAVLILFATPIIIAFIMVFSKTKNILLPYKIIFLAILGLMGAYTMGVMLIGLYNKRTRMFTEDGLLGSLVVIAVYFGLTLVSFALMYPILRYKRKRLKQRL